MTRNAALLIVIIVGSVVMGVVDTLLGISFYKSFGAIPAIIHNTVVMLCGAAIAFVVFIKK